MLSKYLQMAAADLRKVRPTAADQRRNPGIDVTRVWLEDVEHTIKMQEIPAAQTDEFRALAGAK